MKKQLILSLGLVAAISASAQVSLVKEVERNLNSKNEYVKQMNALKPAFTNPETAESAYPYFVAGKYGIKFYEEQEVLSRAGQQVNAKDMGHALIDGFDYLVKAISLDTIVDAKGKVKTKYSKDALKLVNQAFPYFENAGVILWQEQDYKGAYDAWEMIFTVPENKVLGINAPKALPDSVLNIIAFNQGLAAYNLGDWTTTLACFDKSIALGYNDQKVYDFAIATAANFPEGESAELMAKYSEMAYPLYGAENDMYIGNIINNMMQKGQFAEAEELIKGYLATSPNNAQLYFILGALYENETDNPNSADLAMEAFKKCVELDPTHDRAYQQIGLLTHNKAYLADEAATSLSTAEYNKVRETVIDPLLREAAGYLEKAYELNPENQYSTLGNLRSIYYNLSDADNLARIEALQNGN